MLRKGSHKKSYRKADGKKTALLTASGEEKGVMTSMGFISDYALTVAFKKRCPKCGNWGHKREDCKTKSVIAIAAIVILGAQIILEVATN